MLLNNFGLGWRGKFEQRLETLFKYFPETTVEDISRFRGMLRITLRGLDKDIQVILDSVTYKIERESVRICELCGNIGTRRNDDGFEEMKCLCWKCHTIELNKLYESRTNIQ